MTSKDQPTQDRQPAPYYEPKPASMSKAQENGKTYRKHGIENLVHTGQPLRDRCPN